MPGGGGGVEFATTHCTRGVKEVRVWHGQYIDAVQFVFKDDRVSDKYGGDGGKPSSFPIGDDDQLICVDIYSGKYVDALQFTTRDGHVSDKFGGPGGRAQKCGASGGRIIGFRGRAKNLIESLDVALATE